ncbi:MAG: hypothetical protein ABEI53_01640 [Candidatus Magasanikbacteria bacterium]
MLDFIGLFLLLSGFIIGLGAVTVIDLHGFLARDSSYWTKATIRTHKVTKPMIWIGIALAILGGFIFYESKGLFGVPFYHLLIAIALIINGCFLSFVVSPRLNEKEKKGNDEEILEKSLQRKIMASFVVSFVGWWSALAILVYYLII